MTQNLRRFHPADNESSYYSSVRLVQYSFGAALFNVIRAPSPLHGIFTILTLFLLPSSTKKEGRTLAIPDNLFILSSFLLE
jgi:hypothetical protein